MGIPAILAAAMKRISWGQVADIAINYGPDFIKKLKERMQALPAAEAEARATAEQMGERIRELESTLIKQEEMIELQNKNIGLLEENGKTLQARLNIVTTVSACAVILSLVLLMLVLKK